MDQFARNLFALGQIFLENQLTHCTHKYVNLRLQTAEMEASVQDFCLWSPLAKIWVVPLVFAIHNRQLKAKTHVKRSLNKTPSELYGGLYTKNL